MIVIDDTGMSQSCSALQFQHDSFPQFEIVDALDRREPVVLENGNENVIICRERLGSQFVESGVAHEPREFRVNRWPPRPHQDLLRGRSGDSWANSFS